MTDNSSAMEYVNKLLDAAWSPAQVIERANTRTARQNITGIVTIFLLCLGATSAIKTAGAALSGLSTDDSSVSDVVEMSLFFLLGSLIIYLMWCGTAFQLLNFPVISYASAYPISLIVIFGTLLAAYETQSLTEHPGAQACYEHAITTPLGRKLCATRASVSCIQQLNRCADRNQSAKVSNASWRDSLAVVGIPTLWHALAAGLAAFLLGTMMWQSPWRRLTSMLSTLAIASLAIGATHWAVSMATYPTAKVVYGHMNKSR